VRGPRARAPRRARPGQSPDARAHARTCKAGRPRQAAHTRCLPSRSQVFFDIEIDGKPEGEWGRQRRRRLGVRGRARPRSRRRAPCRPRPRRRALLPLHLPRPHRDGPLRRHRAQDGGRGAPAQGGRQAPWGSRPCAATPLSPPLRPAQCTLPARAAPLPPEPAAFITATPPLSPAPCPPPPTPGRELPRAVHRREGHRQERQAPPLQGQRVPPVGGGGGWGWGGRKGEGAGAPGWGRAGAGAARQCAAGGGVPSRRQARSGPLTLRPPLPPGPWPPLPPKRIIPQFSEWPVAAGQDAAALSRRTPRLPARRPDPGAPTLTLPPPFPFPPPSAAGRRLHARRRHRRRVDLRREVCGWAGGGRGGLGQERPASARHTWLPAEGSEGGPRPGSVVSTRWALGRRANPRPPPAPCRARRELQAEAQGRRLPVHGQVRGTRNRAYGILRPNLLTYLFCGQPFSPHDLSSAAPLPAAPAPTPTVGRVWGHRRAPRCLVARAPTRPVPFPVPRSPPPLPAPVDPAPTPGSQFFITTVKVRPAPLGTRQSACFLPPAQPQTAQPTPSDPPPFLAPLAPACLLPDRVAGRPPRGVWQGAGGHGRRHEGAARDRGEAIDAGAGGGSASAKGRAAPASRKARRLPARPSALLPPLPARPSALLPPLPARPSALLPPLPAPIRSRPSARAAASPPRRWSSPTAARSRSPPERQGPERAACPAAAARPPRPPRRRAGAWPRGAAVVPRRAAAF
jgi:hypothetical protein